MGILLKTQLIIDMRTFALALISATAIASKGYGSGYGKSASHHGPTNYIDNKPVQHSHYADVVKTQTYEVDDSTYKTITDKKIRQSPPLTTPPNLLMPDSRTSPDTTLSTRSSVRLSRNSELSRRRFQLLNQESSMRMSPPPETTTSPSTSFAQSRRKCPSLSKSQSTPRSRSRFPRAERSRPSRRRKSPPTFPRRSAPRKVKMNAGARTAATAGAGTANGLRPQSSRPSRSHQSKL